MALPTVTITGTVYDPSGTGVAGGVITITPSAPFAIDDDATSETYRVGGITSAIIAADGTVNFTMIPNQESTTYRARFRIADGRTWEEVWTILSAPASQDIGDL